MGNAVRLKESLLIASRNETGNATRGVVARLFVIHMYTTQRAAMCNELPIGMGTLMYPGVKGGGAVGLCCRPSTKRSECQRAETTVACSLTV